jgi:diguanylate cyclase (GGDEF)-like protein/PAS domain S-box-containing protein
MPPSVMVLPATRVGQAPRLVSRACATAERRQRDQALRQSEALKTSILASLACGIVAADPHGVITTCNACAEAILGYRADELIGKLTPELFRNNDEAATPTERLGERPDLIAHADLDALDVRPETAGTPDERETSCLRKDGQRVSVRLTTTPMHDAQGLLSGYVHTLVDITRHKEAEADIRRLAHADPLTGLANRSLLDARVRQDLSRAHRAREPLALIFLDLDRFKNVNDSLGHRVGDELLIQVAARLGSVVRDEDTLCRLGGDEFVLVLPNTDADGAAHVAAKLLKITAPPYRLEQQVVTCTVSAGIAVYPTDGDNAVALSTCADAAMYRAKARGGNAYCFFTAEMQERLVRTRQIGNDLRRAIANGELHLQYQPRFAIATRRLVGVEALLRWRHGQLGMVSPLEFVPIAEMSELSLPLFEWVLRTAARQLLGWQRRGLPPINVAVNLSAGQFRQTNLSERVARILDEEALPPRFLELEMTENVVMDNPLAAIATIDKLRAHGIGISLDDFGTGRSSMSHLRRLRVDRLKIDRSLVADLPADPDAAAIVAATVSLAHELGLQTVAVGVESATQVAFLRARGCDEAQGCLLGPPVVAEQFAAVARRSTACASVARDRRAKSGSRIDPPAGSCHDHPTALE